MNLSAEILEVICCPETHQDLALVSSQQLSVLNGLQAEGKLKHRSGAHVEYRLSDGLLRKDQQVLYPVREGIPVLLTEEAILIESLQEPQAFKES